MKTVLGGLIVALAGLSMGGGVWTLKALKKMRFEHWLFLGMLVGLIVLPWSVTLLFCPGAIGALRSVPASALIKANLFACGWGIANVLCVVCFVRIGVALTGGILGGLGLSLGVVVPMVFKASGLFSRAPDATSPAGLVVLVGVAIMLAGVVLVSLAGFGRDRMLSNLQSGSNRFSTNLFLAVLAGILSTGPNFAFAYSQEPIVNALKSRGAGDIPAIFAVWAVGMFSGAVINLVYTAFLITRDHSWGVFRHAGKELVFGCIFGMQFCGAIALLGLGNLTLGALGASVGWGVYQAMQILGNQGVGFLSGEWAGVSGKPKRQMYVAIGILLIAALVVAYGNSLVQV